MGILRPKLADEIFYEEIYLSKQGQSLYRLMQAVLQAHAYLVILLCAGRQPAAASPVDAAEADPTARDLTKDR